MTYYEHIPFRENIPAYALGALDAEDVAALEAHLQTCASCREELTAYRDTSDNLLMSTPTAEAIRCAPPPSAETIAGAQKAARSTSRIGSLVVWLWE